MILNHSNASLEFENAKYLEITQDNEHYKSITIPVEGSQYSLTSNLTVIYDDEYKITNYSESLITKSDNNKFVITSYFDGELLQNEETDLDYVSNSELQKQLDYIQSNLGESKKESEPGFQTYGFKKTAACIAAIAGVDMVVAYLIAGTCAASCPAVPPVCAACIAGVATLGTANIAGIIACFSV